MLKNILSTIKNYADIAWMKTKEVAKQAANFVKETYNTIKEAIVEKLSTLAETAVEPEIIVVVDEKSEEQNNQGGTFDGLVIIVTVLASIYIVMNFPITILMLGELYIVNKVLTYAYNWLVSAKELMA